MASIEIDRHFRDMMYSGAFLYALVDPDGFFLMLNHGMESFLRHFPDADGNILSYCPEGQIESLYSLLVDARREFIAALVPLVRSDGTQIWIDAEFMPAEAEGREAIQIIGCDVTELVKLRNEQQNAWSLNAPKGGLSNFWGGVLDSCPGLLCCVINADRKLLYASPGYKAVALRVLGHKCEIGEIYPPNSDKIVRDIAYSAIAGESSSVDIPERAQRRIWNMTAAPLKFGKKQVGAVMRFMAVNNNESDNLQAKYKNNDIDKNKSNDIKDKANQEDKSSNSYEDYKKFLDAFSERVVIVNERGVCLAANPLFINSLNLNNDKNLNNLNIKDDSENKIKNSNYDIVGRPLLDLIPADNTMNAVFHKNFLNNILITRDGESECRISTRDGDVVWLEVKARPLEFLNSQAILLTLSDVTKLKRTQAQLRRITITDGTTGILNRQGIERLIIQRVEKSLHDKIKLSLIIFDVDSFRRVNERLGYSAADRILKAMTLALKGVLSKEEAIGRWGGDEFIVLTPRSGSEAKLLADNLRGMAKNFDNFDGRDDGAITLSAGVAELGAEDASGGNIEDHTSLISAAYDAMIQAKRMGGDNTVLHGIYERGSNL